MTAQRKFVYIVSSPHGGSTLFSHVLGKHPDAQNLGEVSFIPKLLSLNEPCSCGTGIRDCAWWGKVFTTFRGVSGTDLRQSPYGVYFGDAPKPKSGSGLIDHRYQTRLRYAMMKLRGAVDTATVLYAPRTVGLRRASMGSIALGADNTLAFYAAAADCTGARLIIDASKMPRKAAQLYCADPTRVRIVHLTRDGRGVVASRKSYMPATQAARRWSHYHRLSQRLLERWVPTAHRIRLSYEEFAAHPEATLRQVFDWLDMSYSDQCLQFGDDVPAHSAGGNPARFEMAGGIRAADERWRSALSEQELLDFERTAGQLNRQLGYE
jgi:Sulfotransferase family